MRCYSYIILMLHSLSNITIREVIVILNCLDMCLRGTCVVECYTRGGYNERDVIRIY